MKSSHFDKIWRINVEPLLSAINFGREKSNSSVTWDKRFEPCIAKQMDSGSVLVMKQNIFGPS